MTLTYLLLLIVIIFPRVRKRKSKYETRSNVCEDDVDRISALSDDLLVRILSFLPTTREAAYTTVLSIRWERLWMWLPKLNYNSNDSESLRRFLDLNMPLHRSPVIHSFHLRLEASLFGPQDIKLWLVIALSRYLRELSITYRGNSESPSILPSSLYTCKSLVILKLRGEICLDVPRLACLPSLKTLELESDNYLEGESLRRLLSVCPVLENLYVFCDGDNDDVGLITVTVPSLKRLSFYMPGATDGVIDGLLLDTPSLKYLKLQDFNEASRPTFSVEAMPNLEEAYVDLRYYHNTTRPGRVGSVVSIERVMSSITFVMRLTICLKVSFHIYSLLFIESSVLILFHRVQFLYGVDLVFNKLEHLKLCVCTRNSSNLPARFLEDSPNLRVLDIFLMVPSFFH